MRSPRRPDSMLPLRVPYEMLVEVNRRLLDEKVELLEEISQLRAAVKIYQELAARHQNRAA